MTDAETGDSIRRSGFLASELGNCGAGYRQANPPLFDLMDELNELGQRQLVAGCNVAGKLSSNDPINIGTRLLIRTMSSFQGAILLAARGMTVEALTLVRGCYENGFWLAYFSRQPKEAMQAFEYDELKSQTGLADALARIIAPIDPSDISKVAVEALLEGRPAKVKGQSKGVEELARDGGLHANYAFFKQISSMAAHPSLNSIDRYLDKDENKAWTGFVTGPDNAGVETCVVLACHATFSALSTFIGLRGEPWTADDEMLADLWERFRPFAGIEQHAPTAS